jgi:3-methyl-2-oxobutanoate hydroxymethyltransferase
MSVQVQTQRHTLRSLQALFKKGEKITMLTAYDAITAQCLDEAGIEILLVGDSLGNVVLGHGTTLPVTLDDMIRHTAAVVRGTARTLVVCDLPFGVATDPEAALRASIRVMQETGCQAVKLEGGAWAAPIVERLTQQGIPVMAHIGLQPQSVNQLGGFYKHGKTEEAAQRLRDDALALTRAGAFAVVLEMVVPELATEITRELPIPTIGIGSGPECAGQVLVINDLVGLSVRPAPSFAKPRANVAEIIRRAAAEYREEVKQGPALEAQNRPAPGLSPFGGSA